jgi:hypothetical protein
MRHQFITSKKNIVINGFICRHDWYRVECHKISGGINLIFGTLPNIDEFYICVLRCKLYTCINEKYYL